MLEPSVPAPSEIVPRGPIERPTSKQSPFFQLPGEIRNLIYGYALTLDNNNTPLYLDTLRAPTLAFVSRQVRQECLPIFLQSNRFITLFCPRADQTEGHYLWFANHTLSWLSEVSFHKPTINDIYFVLTPPDHYTDMSASQYGIVCKGTHRELYHPPQCFFCCPDERPGGIEARIEYVRRGFGRLAPHLLDQFDSQREWHGYDLEDLHDQLFGEVDDEDRALSIMEIMDMAWRVKGGAEQYAWHTGLESDDAFFELEGEFKVFEWQERYPSLWDADTSSESEGRED